MRKIPPFLHRWKSDLLHVWYPSFCLICETENNHTKSGICPVCEQELHYTYFEDYTEPTPLDQLFWGRVPVHASYAMLYFRKQGGTQSILHALKYKDRPEVARYFGGLIGERLVKMERFRDLDALIPVPLHPKKAFIRGYNQSKVLAEGIREFVPVALRDDLLRRVAFTESQTRKGKESRWENMQNGFQVTTIGSVYPKHVALVDDVVTTGSTLETCIRLLQGALPDTRISIVSLAVAR